jgi:hypothetical protein
MAQKVFIVVALLIFGGIIHFKKSKDEIRPRATSIKRRKPMPVQNPNLGNQPIEQPVPQETTLETTVKSSFQNAEQTSQAVEQPSHTVLVSAPNETPQVVAVAHVEAGPKVQMEQTKQEVKSLIADAKLAIFLKCSCSVHFEVMWGSFENALALKKAGYTVENFKQAMPSYCADDGKAMACKIKSVRISFAMDPDISYSAGVATLTTNGIVHKTFDELIAIVEKQ